MFLDLTTQINKACKGKVDPFIIGAKGSGNYRKLKSLDAVEFKSRSGKNFAFDNEIRRLSKLYYAMLEDLVGLMGNVHDISTPLSIANLDNELRQLVHNDFPREVHTEGDVPM